MSLVFLLFSSMEQGILFLFSLFVFISCNEYKFESCILHSRSDTLIIDLSDNLDDSWLTTTDNPNITYYFSLCPKGKSKCPGNSFFCLNFNNGTILDLGSTYMGTSDDVFGDTVIYNMSLKGQHGSGFVSIQCYDSPEPPLLISLTNRSKDGLPHYDFVITWRSSTNCPLKHFSVRNNCILYTHPRSYDLRSLRRSHRVSVAGKDYIINICEVMSSNCPSYVCEVGNGGRLTVLSNVFELSYMEPKRLSFNYPSPTGRNIVINLHCSFDEEDYKLNPVSNNGDDLVFFVKTPLVCEFPAINCLLLDQDKNIAYDLYPLNKMIDNYEWQLGNGKKLLFNVCGPLNYVPQIPCADGVRNYGCIVNNENQTEAVATFSNVTVLGPGKIFMVYNSSNLQNNKLFVYISLKCSKDVSVNPTISKTGVNSFNINWNTYTACPLKYSAGENCEVKNLYNESKVNLMPLHKRNSDYFIVNGKESFRINICGVLNQSCSRNRNAAVCFKNSNGTEIAIGETGSLKPNFIDGQFIFNLEGEPCHNNATKSRVKIIMACEFSNMASSNYSPELFSSTKENECIYYFHWKTPLVCGSPVSSKCTFSNQDMKFNLSSLINLRENYIVNYNDDTEIEVNICHSLIPGHRIHCHELSGACLKNHSINSILSAAYDNFENNENLGLASDEFEIIDNNIRLYYRNGGICRTSKVGNTYSTIIDFVCNKTASQSEPKLISVKDCEYNFSWETSAACPTYESKTPCSINISNKTYDFSNLMEKSFLVKTENSKGPLNYEINIGICSPVDIIGCSRKSGSCLVSGGTAENLGNYNSKLQYINESLLLVYEGVDCKSTVIEFSCGHSESSGPVLIKRNNCSTIISWPTKLGCFDDYRLNEMKCCQGIEDLCEKLNETYEVEISKQEKAFINICRPLLPKWGILCPSGSVSCLANNESSDSFSLEKGLGSFMLSPVFLNDKTAILKYFDGSVCHKDPDIRYSTSITFFCDGDVHIGRPELVNISDDCQYEFKWATSLMCHEKCTLPIGNKNIDVLQQFQNLDKRIFSKNGLEKSPYILNLCQVSTSCGSHICKLDKTLKWLRFAEFNGSQSIKDSNSKTKLFYKYLRSNTSKDSCGAQVDLICDNNDRGAGRPYLEQETECFIHVIWKSNLACSSEKSSESSSNIIVWCIFSVAILALAVIVVVILKFNRQLDLGSCVNKTLGYRRDLEIAELQM